MALALFRSRRGEAAQALLDLNAALEMKVKDAVDVGIAEVLVWARLAKLAAGADLKGLPGFDTALEIAPNRAKRFVNDLDKGDVARALHEARRGFLGRPEHTFWALAVHRLAEQGEPATARVWQSRVRSALRFQRVGPWALDVLDRWETQRPRPSASAGSTPIR